MKTESIVEGRTNNLNFLLNEESKILILGI